MRNKMKRNIAPLIVGSLVAAGAIVAVSMWLGYGQLSFYFGAIYAALYFLVLILVHVIALKVGMAKSYLGYSALGFALPSAVFLSIYHFSETSAGLVDGAVGYGVAGFLGALSLCAVVRQSA